MPKEPVRQPPPQGLLFVQNGGRRNPWPRLPKWLQILNVFISFEKRFQIAKKQTGLPDAGNKLRKSHFILSRDKIPYDSWSISAALARGFSNRHLNEEKALGTRLPVRSYKLPEHACAGLVTLCHFRHIPQVSHFVRQHVA